MGGSPHRRRRTSGERRLGLSIDCAGDVRFGFIEAQVAAFSAAAEVALVATHPDYEARTEPATRGAPRAARGPARHNKGPSDRLTRDNSVRKSLQVRRTCAILFVRRIW